MSDEGRWYWPVRLPRRPRAYHYFEGYGLSLCRKWTVGVGLYESEPGAPMDREKCGVCLRTLRQRAEDRRFAEAHRNNAEEILNLIGESE